ncbi:hypothetical protein ACLOJK_017008 [Asimina triloba]
MEVDEVGHKSSTAKLDEEEDDGRLRTGTVWTATAHAVTAVIGSGVLALPWSVAQMGWVLGPLALSVFAYVTYYTATLLSDCYRSPDPVKGRRNPTYMKAMWAYASSVNGVVGNTAQTDRENRKKAYDGDDFLYYALGDCCRLYYYSSYEHDVRDMTRFLSSLEISVTTPSSNILVSHHDNFLMNERSFKRSNCYHEHGHNARCTATGTWFLLIFGGIEVILSQFPNLEKVTLLSVVAAVMSFGYSFIALYLCIVKLASSHDFRGTLSGVRAGYMGVSMLDKVWHSFQALGNIAFAYTYAMLLIEIQVHGRATSKNKTMKRATLYGIGITTLFYVSLGCVGYAAFGNAAPGNVLTGFQEPFWLVDISNLAVVIHLIGAYQVYVQPMFAFYEKWLAKKWPTTGFFHTVYTLRFPFIHSFYFQFTMCKLILRTVFVVFTTVVAMLLPFFNAVLGFLGALAFWPLTVYFPVTMYMAQAKIKSGTRKWIVLQGLSMFALAVSLISAVGSVADIVERLKHAKVFSITL